MKVKIHTLFKYLMDTTSENPESILGYSLSKSPKLKDFMGQLDPEMSLDWNLQSFWGLPALRENVLAQAGISTTLTPDNVLITAGAAEANYLVLRQLLAEGDEIVLEKPGWPQAEVMAIAMGLERRYVERQEADNWSLPLAQLETAITAKTKLVFITNPNNPTGALASDEEMQKLADICARNGTWLLVDEVYAGLEWSRPRSTPIAAFYERGITTGSVSKALGLQGLRTGWLITQSEELRFDAMILRENSSEIMNVMGEAIAEIALRPENLGPALAGARMDGEKNLKMLDQFLSQQRQLSWIEPQAGLIGMARVADHIDVSALAKRLLQAPYKTFLIPGEAYGLPQHMRLGVGGGEEANLKLGLTRLAACLKEFD